MPSVACVRTLNQLRRIVEMKETAFRAIDCSGRGPGVSNFGPGLRDNPPDLILGLAAVLPANRIKAEEYP